MHVIAACLLKLVHDQLAAPFLLEYGHRIRSAKSAFGETNLCSSESYDEVSVRQKENPRARVHVLFRPSLTTAPRKTLLVEKFAPRTRAWTGTFTSSPIVV